MSCPWRLKKTLSSFSIATARSLSSSPSMESSRMPCGRSVMPTPSSRKARAVSKTRHVRPRAWSESANARPAMPPPATRISKLFGLDARGLDDLAPARRLGPSALGELRGRAGDDLHALFRKHLLHVRECQRLLQVGVDLPDDRG